MYNSNYIPDAMLDHMAEEYYLNNPCVGSAEYYEKCAHEEEERERYDPEGDLHDTQQHVGGQATLLKTKT